MTTTFVEISHSLQYHHKVFALADKLHETRAAVIGYLACLWNFAVANAQDGNLSNFDLDGLAKEITWPRAPQEFFDALVNVGFLDRDGAGHLFLHDWKDHCKISTEKKIKHRWYVAGARSKNKKQKLQCQFDLDAVARVKKITKQEDYENDSPKL